MLKTIFFMFIELLQAVVAKVEEWSHEPLFWAYAIGAVFAFLLFSQGWWLAGWIVLALTMLIEKRNPTKRAPDAGESAASQTLSPQSGESTPEVEPATSQRR